MDGMDDATIRKYLSSSDCETWRSKHLLALAASKLGPSNDPETQSLSLSASTSHFPTDTIPMVSSQGTSSSLVEAQRDPKEGDGNTQKAE